MAKLTGSISESPESLAAKAGYDVDLYSLARVGESEESGIGSVAVMFATMNWSKKQKISITQLVTRSRTKDENGKVIVAPGDGHYGTQLHRYCASHYDPSSEMLIKAGQVITHAIQDPTNGATHWDAPELQDKLHDSDPDNHPSSEEVARRRESSGMHMVIIDGVTKTRFWR